jgi:hypothetical protein
MGLTRVTAPSIRISIRSSPKSLVIIPAGGQDHMANSQVRIFQGYRVKRFRSFFNGTGSVFPARIRSEPVRCSGVYRMYFTQSRT